MGFAAEPLVSGTAERSPQAIRVRGRLPNLRVNSLRGIMLNWALLFLLVALIAGALGFTGIAGSAAYLAKILFVIFLVFFLVTIIRGDRKA